MFCCALSGMKVYNENNKNNLNRSLLCCTSNWEQNKLIKNKFFEIYVRKKISDKVLSVIKIPFFYLLFAGLIILQFYPGASTAFCAKTVDRIVAIVNDKIITLYDLNISIKSYLNEIENMELSNEKKQEIIYSVRGKAINKLVDELLADQEIEKSKISISEKELDDTIEQIKEMNNHTDEELREALAEKEIPFEEYRKTIKQEISRSRLINREVKSKIVITNGEIESYYNEHIGEYGTKIKYNLKNIIKMVNYSIDAEEKHQVYQKMEKILERLESGESFEQMAQTYSESPFAAEGGDLGSFEIKELSPVIQEGLKGKKPGDITSIIETDQGYQIFYIKDVITSAGSSVEDVTTEIQEILYKKKFEKKFQEWIDNIREKALIKIIK